MPDDNTTIPPAPPPRRMSRVDGPTANEAAFQRRAQRMQSLGVAPAATPAVPEAPAETPAPEGGQ